MTKQLREWTAPEEKGAWRYRWNPDFYCVQVLHPDGWCPVDHETVLEHADAFKELRADPYVAPKGLREKVRDELAEFTVNASAYWLDRYTDQILSLIDRERPTLGKVLDEWAIMSAKGIEAQRVDCQWKTEGAREFFDLQRPYDAPHTVYRLALIAPERAG